MRSSMFSLISADLKSGMMETELVSETLYFHPGLTRFIARENFSSVNEILIISLLLRCTISKCFVQDNTSLSFRSPYLFCLPTVGVEVVYFHLITLRHTTQSVGLLWTRDHPVTENCTWQKNTHKRQISMPAVGFEPMIPANARPPTYALDVVATGIG
jgi:hypothetical protein